MAGELWWARHYAWENERTAANKALGWRMRRDARHQEAELAERVTSAEERLEKLLAVEDARLTEALNRAKEKVSDINQEIGRREQWLDDHPRATPQLQQLNGQVNQLDHENDHERWTVEGELNPRPAPTPRIERSHLTR